MENSPPRKKRYIALTTAYKLKKVLKRHTRDRLGYGFYTIKGIWRKLVSSMYIKEVIVSAFGRFKYLWLKWAYRNLSYKIYQRK